MRRGCAEDAQRMRRGCATSVHTLCTTSVCTPCTPTIHPLYTHCTRSAQSVQIQCTNHCVRTVHTHPLRTDDSHRCALSVRTRCPTSDPRYADLDPFREAPITLSGTETLQHGAHTPSTHPCTLRCIDGVHAHISPVSANSAVYLWI